MIECNHVKYVMSRSRFRNQPEMKFASDSIQHSSGDLRGTNNKGREKGEQDAAHDHVMKVRDDDSRNR